MADTPLGRYLMQQADFKDPSSSSSPLPALYADLAAHKSSNRTSFEASVDWWARLLFKAALIGVQSSTSVSLGKGKQAEESNHGDRLVLHLNQKLVDDYTIDEVGRPLGLGTVALELQQSRRIYPLNMFLSSLTKVAGPDNTQRRLSSTVFSIASFPLTWAFSQVSLSLGFGEGDDVEGGERDWKKARGDWVVWDNVQALTEAILSIHRSSPRLSPLESLYSMHTFQTQLVNPAIRQLSGKPQTEGDSPLLCSNLDVKVLIKFMERDRRVAVTDGSVIKLEHIEGEELKAISEEEKGIVNVKDTYARLESQVEEIEKRIKERQSKVETALREKKREQALSYLRSRKMLDELLEKRTRSMETLHGVLIKIEQAASDVEIVKAYELSTSSLKALLSDSRLQPEHIEASMDEMQETLADADEVRRAVEAGNEGISRAAGEEEMDDEEMEAELKRLEEENEREKTIEKNKTSQAVPEQTLEPLKNNERTDPVIQQESKEKDHLEAIAA